MLFSDLMKLVAVRIIHKSGKIIKKQILINFKNIRKCYRSLVWYGKLFTLIHQHCCGHYSNTLG